MTSDLEVGEAIAKARGLAGLSQHDLAASMPPGFGWKQQTVWKLEAGHRKLTYLEAAALAEVVPFGIVTASSGENYYMAALERVKSLIDKELGK